MMEAEGCPNSKVKLGNRIQCANMVILDKKDFDIILSINLLIRYKAHFDYPAKSVDMNGLDGMEFSIYRIPNGPSTVISAIYE